MIKRPLSAYSIGLQHSACNLWFNDQRGSGLAPESTPVQPSKGLAFEGFNLFNTTEGVTLLKDQSKPNFASSITLLQIAQGQASMIITDGKTNSFSLTSCYNECVAASQTGAVLQTCTVKYTAVRIDGTVVSTSCTFTAPLVTLEPKEMALCMFPKGITNLKSVSVFPEKAALTPASTVVNIDTLSGEVSS
ncbi:MAG: hypothetical protein Q9192_006404 [Flavoplaca navasiana]